MTGYIYGLVGPDGIRYVGLTRRTLDVRYQSHAREALYGKRNWHVYRWWRSLDVPPQIVQIEECAVDLLAEREIAWIAKLRADGVRLCNHTDGGQGGTPDAQTREKIRLAANARYLDPAARAKTSAAGRRRFVDPAERDKASVTALERFSRADYRANMSAAITRRFSDQAERDRLRDLTRKSWENYTPEQREARCAAMRAGRAASRARKAAA